MAKKQNEAGFAGRARAALDVWRGKAVARPALPSGSKKAPFAWPAWRDGQPHWELVDLQSYAEQGFSMNTLIYSAVMYKARALQQAPLRVYAGDPRRPVELRDETHPLVQLTARPNRHQSFAEFQAQNVVYLNIAGNVFIYLDRPNRDALPTAMYSLRPDRVHVIPKGDGIRGYVYRPEGTSIRDGMPMLPQDVIHIKLPNPLDQLEGMGLGMSPIAPMAQSADVDNAVTHYLKLFFQNAAMPYGLLKFDTELDEDDVARIRRRWMEIYGSYEQWVDIGILDSGGDYQQLGMTFEQMGFEALDERNESRILGPFGVPPILIGTRVGLARSTYSNYETARRACWEDTLVPELQLFEVDYQYYLRSDDGAWVKYDTSAVPALQQDVPMLADAAYKLWQMGMPAQQAWDLVGLDAPRVPGANVAYVPAGLMPVGSIPAMTPAEMDAEEDLLEEGPTEEEAPAEGEELDAVSDERGQDGKARTSRPKA